MSHLRPRPFPTGEQRAFPGKLHASGAFVMREGDPNVTGQVFVHGTQTGEQAVALAHLFAAAPALQEAVVHLRDAFRILGYAAAPDSPVARSVELADAALAAVIPPKEEN